VVSDLVAERPALYIPPHLLRTGPRTKETPNPATPSPSREMVSRRGPEQHLHATPAGATRTGQPLGAFTKTQLTADDRHDAPSALGRPALTLGQDGSVLASSRTVGLGHAAKQTFGPAPLAGWRATVRRDGRSVAAPNSGKCLSDSGSHLPRRSPEPIEGDHDATHVATRSRPWEPPPMWRPSAARPRLRQLSSRTRPPRRRPHPSRLRPRPRPPRHRWFHSRGKRRRPGQARWAAKRSGRYRRPTTP
jgi:hypothetical protein